MSLKQKQIDVLTKLMLHRRGEEKEWDSMEELEKDAARREVLNFIDDLAKIDMEIQPKGEMFKNRQALRADRILVTNFIKDFLRKKVKVPSNAADIIPCDELGAQLVLKFSAREKEGAEGGEK